jgi:hypothetical protein
LRLLYCNLSTLEYCMYCMTGLAGATLSINPPILVLAHIPFESPVAMRIHAWSLQHGHKPDGRKAEDHSRGES